MNLENLVEFPKLGWAFNVNPEAFSIGNVITINWYGILIATAFLVAVLLAVRHSEGFGIKQDDFIDMVLWVAPMGIIGARLFYVIFSWNNYKDDFTGIYKIWEGGLAIYGGIIAGIVTAIIYAKVKKIPILKLLDFAVVYLPLAQSIGRWGNFVNQEAFGGNTNLPWGMTSNTVKQTLSTLKMEGINVDPMVPVHPTFFYESLLDFCVFWILLNIRKNKKADGEVIFLYMVLYGFGRFFIEGLRTDSLMLGNMRISQLLAALFVVVFGALLIYIKRKSLSNDEHIEIGQSEFASTLKKINEQTAAEMLESDSKLIIHEAQKEKDIEKDIEEEEESIDKDKNIEKE